ncbi:uncharacterized protein LOC143847906 [Tasmannia lanceolata]|uniref:uncharacterized protein LOC143847906 n=1 Tax=Tasmannia lanceolata TaxID=3420 RepID=UPI004062F300
MVVTLAYSSPAGLSMWSLKKSSITREKTSGSKKAARKKMAIISCPILPKRQMSVQEFKDWLMKYDADHDGRISQEELQHALRSLHTWFTWWKSRDAMKEADHNRNGNIDKDEIEKLVIYAQKNLNMKIHA